MKELIDEKVFESILLDRFPLVLIITGTIFAIQGWRIKCGWLRTTGIALYVIGIGLPLLWLAYSGVVQHFGLDSVKGLGVNIAIFAIVGGVAGVLVGRWRRRKQVQS